MSESKTIQEIKDKLTEEQIEMLRQFLHCYMSGIKASGPTADGDQVFFFMIPFCLKALKWIKRKNVVSSKFPEVIAMRDMLENILNTNK